MSTPDPAPPLGLAPHAIVLRRTPDELQVGVSPGVVVPAAYAAVLPDRQPVAESTLMDRARAAGLHPTATRSVLAALREAQLLVPAPAPEPLRSAAVRLVGGGLLGRRTVSLLAGAGVGALYLSEPPVPAARPKGPGDGPDRLETFGFALRRRHPSLEVHRPAHWAKPEDARIDLTLLAADGPEVDRLVADTLVAGDQPHLVLRSSGREVSVGPLVLPGRTSCLRCADLTRRDADPQWPWVLAQLTGVRLDPAPSLLAWASACAAAQTLAFLSGGRPESASSTLELGTADHTMRLRAWPPHPGCGCGWGDRTE